MMRQRNTEEDSSQQHNVVIPRHNQAYNEVHAGSKPKLEHPTESRAF